MAVTSSLIWWAVMMVEPGTTVVGDDQLNGPSPALIRLVFTHVRSLLMWQAAMGMPTATVGHPNQGQATCWLHPQSGAAFAWQLVGSV